MSRRTKPSVTGKRMTRRRLSGPAALVGAGAPDRPTLATTDDEYLRTVSIAPPNDARSAHTPLTARQQLVLRGVFDGLSNKEIGGLIGVSESAVKATVQQLFRKLRSRTRAQLVRRVVEGAPETSRGLHA